MKTTPFLIVAMMAISTNVLSQIDTEKEISVNNIRAYLNANGELFHKQMASGIHYSPEFEFPKGDTTHPIFAGFFWFGAQETDTSAPRVAAQRYFASDFFAGPLSQSFSVYRDPILKLTKEMIDEHYRYYNWPNYTMPNEIANWPGNGSAIAGEPIDMAPFIDRNNNGYYDPENGDVPSIMGDEAVFLTFNDAAGLHHASGSLPIGIEFKY